MNSPSDTTINVVLLLVGIVWIVAGWRFFKPTMFACGAYLGGWVGAAAGGSTLIAAGSVGTPIIAVCSAIAMGALVLKLFWLGIFCCGALLGAMVGSALCAAIDLSGREAIAVIAGLALVCGFATIKLKSFKRWIVVHSTALSGACFVIFFVGFCTDEFTGAFDPQAMWLTVRQDGRQEYGVAVAALYGFGVLVQWRCSAAGKRGAKDGESDSVERQIQGVRGGARGAGPVAAQPIGQSQLVLELEA